MTEYTINKLLVLKLEYGKTIIYVNGNRFRQCKRLMINIQKQDIPVYDEIDSIDEAADTFKLSLWRNKIFEGPLARPSRIQNETITPEQEFWGHCSNLQAWYDHDYDTRLLHSNLAFPLLKALVDAGDNDAKRMFKTEILERLESGHPNVIISIVGAKLLDYFSLEEKKELIRINYAPKLLDWLKPEEKKEFVRKNVPIVLEYFKKIAKNVPNFFPYIFKEGLLDYLDLNEEEQLTKVDYPIILEFMKKMSKTFNKKYKHKLSIIERNFLASLNLEEIKQIFHIHQNFDAILKDLRKRNFNRKDRILLERFISKDNIICVQCGMRLSADYAFCDKCGTKIVSDFTPSTKPKRLDDRYPFPYIFNLPKPPLKPPKNFAMAPQVQVHASLKEKDPEDRYSCQYCGRKLTKEEKFTHSCKDKPKNA